MTQSLKFRIEIVESVDVGYYVYYYLYRVLTRIISTDVLYLSSALQRFEICLRKRFAIPAATHQQPLTFSFIYKIFVLYIKGSLRTAMRKDYKLIHILSFNRYAPLWRIHIRYGRFWKYTCDLTFFTKLALFPTVQPCLLQYLCNFASVITYCVVLLRPFPFSAFREIKINRLT